MIPNEIISIIMSYKDHWKKYCSICFGLSLGTNTIQNCSSCGKTVCTNCEKYTNFERRCIIRCCYCYKGRCKGKTIEHCCKQCSEYRYGINKMKYIYDENKQLKITYRQL